MLKKLVLLSLFCCINLSVADDGDSSFFGELFKGMANEAGRQIVRSYVERKNNERYQPEPTPQVQQQAHTINDEIRRIVQAHFEADNQCQIDKSMEYYYEQSVTSKI